MSTESTESEEHESPSSGDPRSRAWIEVDPGALRRNYRRLARSVPAGCRLIPMVKADGYGLGMTRVVDALAPFEPWGWGVATPEEGAGLRAHGVRDPVVVFSPLPPGSEPRVVAAGLTPTVSDLDTVDRLRRVADTTLPVHVEIDTGMGRAGFRWDTVQEWGPGLKARLGGALRWEGVYTHFHSADEGGGPGVREQLRRFESVLRVLDPPEGVIRHVQNTAGMLRLGEGEASYGLARPGIGLYGGGSGPDLPEPEPVVAARCRVVRVVEVAPGATLGYGATYRASGPERWATLAIGYGDGYRRAASNGAHVLVSGRRVPVVGRVSMDVTVVNITGLDGVRPGNVATLLGRDGEAEIRLDELAGWMGTIAYEVLTGFTRRLPRVWLPSSTD
jgi:alanine racemase